MHRQGLGVLALAAAIGCGSSSGSSGDTSSEDALTACAAGATVKGVDVSKYQGSIDWNAVKAGGTDFAFIRVSDGANSPDSYFAKNWDGAKGAGLVRGAYQFFRPAQDAAGQADLLVKAIGTLDDADITPVLDVEVTDGVSSLVLQQRMHTWLDAVESGQQHEAERTGDVERPPGTLLDLGRDQPLQPIEPDDVGRRQKARDEDDQDQGQADGRFTQQRSPSRPPGRSTWRHGHDSMV